MRTRPPMPPPAPPSPVPLFPPLALEIILPGDWQVRTQTPGGLGNLQIVLTPEGSFHGELLGPDGPNVVECRWQADTPSRRILLRGRQSVGLQIRPYSARMQVSFFDAQQIVGLNAHGEQVTWHKLTPAA